MIQTLEQQDLPARSARLATRMLENFHANLSESAAIRGIRGKGMMFGIELDRPCGELVTRALEAGLLINVTAENVIRLLPPLILNEEEADQIVERVCKLIAEFTAMDTVAA